MKQNQVFHTKRSRCVCNITVRQWDHWQICKRLKRIHCRGTQQYLADAHNISSPKLRANQETTCVAFPTQSKVISDNNELSHDGERPEDGVSSSEKDVVRRCRNTRAARFGRSKLN